MKILLTILKQLFSIERKVFVYREYGAFLSQDNIKTTTRPILTVRTLVQTCHSTVHTILFIRKVEKRSALYNINLKEYSDIGLD